MKVSRGFLTMVSLVLILGGAVAAGAYLWQRAERRALASDLYMPPKYEMTREMRWLQGYLRINTTNPPGNETEGARFLQRVLAEHGIESEIIESAPGRGSLYARLKGRDSGNALLLMHHIDVVPAEGEWRSPPFAGGILQGYLWGRGTLDMKGIGIAHLAAFVDIAASGVVPRRDIVFLAAADEEEGSRFGLQWLLDHRPELFDGITACLTEGGVTEMSAGEITYFGIEIGSLALFEWELRGDYDELRRARLALQPYMDPLEPSAVPPAVRDYFSTVAPRRVVFTPWLEDIESTIERGEYFHLPATYRSLLEDRLYVFPMKAGDTRMKVTMVLPPPHGEAEARRLMDEALGGHPVEVELIQKDPPASFSPVDTPLFHAIGKAAREHLDPDLDYGPVVISRTVTDSRFLRARGIVCYGFWPYPVDFFLTQTVHGWGERVRLDDYQRGVRMMSDLVRAVSTT